MTGELSKEPDLSSLTSNHSLVPFFVLTEVLTPKNCLKVIDLLEHVIFPLDGYPAPSPHDPSPEEARSLRDKLEMRLQEVIPSKITHCETVIQLMVSSAVIKNTFYSVPTDIVTILEPLGNAGCNSHLVGMTIDSAIATLIPELVIIDRQSPRGVEDPASPAIPKSVEDPG